ncbi:MAG: DUF3021 family protein [Clostridia bacterium]|nr:DUF3021 family protein [Clostridia bacterium]
MKTVFPMIKRILSQSCICFTLLVLALFLIGSAFPGFGNAIEVGSILSIFGFSLLLSCANLILRIKKIPLILRVVLHFVACLIPFYVMFVVIISGRTEAGAILADFLLFLILYALIMGAYLFFRTAFERTMESKGKTYESIYKK